MHATGNASEARLADDIIAAANGTSRVRVADDVIALCREQADALPPFGRDEEGALLRDVAENRPLGDTTTLADPTVVAELQSRGQSEADDES